VEYNKAGDLWRWGAEAEAVDEQFNPGIGFVRRTGIAALDGYLSFRPRPEKIESIRQFFFTVSGEYLEGRSDDPDIDGVRQDNGIHFTQESQFESGDSVGIHEHWLNERINEDFFIAEDVVIPPGDYNNNIVELYFNTFNGRRVFGFGNINYGNFFGGHRTQMGGGVTTRFNQHLSLATSYFYNRVRLPGGDFDTNLWITQVDYAFSPELFGGALIQWNDQSDTLDLNLRLDFIHTPGSDLFVVYNQELNTSKNDGEPRTNRRGGIVKATYLFQF
jgi:hypothetical protein